MRQHRSDQNGFSSGAGLVATAVGLLLTAGLLLLSVNVFSGSGGSGATASDPSILSQSPAQTQIKLCAEGRNSSYGDPPSSAQQATCVRDLLGEVSAGGSTVPGSS
jgi:hypothetical protein